MIRVSRQVLVTPAAIRLLGIILADMFADLGAVSLYELNQEISEYQRAFESLGFEWDDITRLLETLK